MTPNLRLSLVALLFAISLPAVSESAFAAPSQSAPPVSDELTVALWHFDEGQGREVLDAVSKSKAVASESVEWGKGKFGSAANFNGSTAKISLPGGLQNFKADESFTFEAWIKVLKGGATQQIVSGSPLFELEVRPEGHVSFNMAALDGSASARCNGRTDIVDGKWHHVAAVRDTAAGKMKFYLDGHLDGEVVDPTANRTAVAIPLNATFGSTPDGREALQGSIDEVRISKIARTFTPLAASTEPEDLKKHVLENSQVKITLAIYGSKLFLQEIVDKKTGVNFIESGIAAPRMSNLWKISMRSEAGTPQTTSAILSEDESTPVVSRRKSAKGEELQIKWTGLPVANEQSITDVTTKIYLPATSALSQWRIKVDNRSKKFGAWIVKFPAIGNLKKLSADGQKEFFTIPGGGQNAGAGEGQLVQDPFKNLVNSVRTYPCYQQSMQFNAYYGPKGGLYLATYDGDMNLKGFNSYASNQAKPTLNYEVENYPANSGLAGTGFHADYPSVIGPFKGDWYDASQIYRQWALKQKWARLGPLHQRKDLSPAIKKGSFWMIGTLAHEPTDQPHLRSLARTLPVEEVQKRARRVDVEKSLARVKEAHDYFGYPIILWSNEWWEGGGDYSPPRYLPLSNLQEYLTKLHQRYPEITFDGYVAPKRYSVQIREYNGDVKWSLEKKPNGDYAIEAPGPNEYGDQHAYPCWSTPLWKKTWADLSYNRSALGLDGFHVDELGSHTSFDHQCFNRDHGHPIGGGTLYADTRRAMMKTIRENSRRANPNFSVHHEVLCEIYIDQDDLSEVCTSPANNNIPLYEAVYHDYNFTMGRRIIKYMDRNTYAAPDDTANNRNREPGDQGMEEFVASFAETFIWGNQPAWMRTDIASYAPKVAAVTKKFMDARYRSLKFLNFGAMMRPLTVTKALPKVKTIWRMNDTPEHIQPAILNSVWKAADGTIGIVLANVSQQKQTINYNFDLAEAGLKAKSFKVRRIDGKTPEALGTTTKALLQRADTVEPWSVKIIEVAPVR